MYLVPKANRSIPPGSLRGGFYATLYLRQPQTYHRLDLILREGFGRGSVAEPADDTKLTGCRERVACPGAFSRSLSPNTPRVGHYSMHGPDFDTQCEGSAVYLAAAPGDPFTLAVSYCSVPLLGRQKVLLDTDKKVYLALVHSYHLEQFSLLGIDRLPLPPRDMRFPWRDVHRTRTEQHGANTKLRKIAQTKTRHHHCDTTTTESKQKARWENENGLVLRHVCSCFIFHVKKKKNHDTTLARSLGGHIIRMPKAT